MRVVVTGMVATYPVGGVAWDYLQYVEGLRRLGCDVFYLEDTGQWFYDSAGATFVRDARAGARYLANALAQLAPGMDEAWSVRDLDGTLHGQDAAAVRRACAGADLFVNVSGASRLRDEYAAAGVLAFVDTDPCYCQARALAVERGTVDPQMRDAVDIMRRHDVFFTLGEHIGAPDCAIPSVGIAWRPTRQPILLDHWQSPPLPEGAFTTVMSWRIDPPPPIVDGRVYGGEDGEVEGVPPLPPPPTPRVRVGVAGGAPRQRDPRGGPS